MRTPRPRFYWQFLSGWILIITGVALVLHGWNDLMVLIKGLIGPVLTVSGLLILYLAQNRSADSSS